MTSPTLHLIERLRVEQTQMPEDTAEDLPVGLVDRLAKLILPSPVVQSEETIPTRIGRYDILNILGRGGLGIVYRGYDSQLHRYVAIKVLTAGRFAEEKSRLRFQRECALMAGLKHDYIVPVYEADTPADGMPYLVMPVIEGRSLAKVIQQDKNMPLATVAAYGIQIAEALDAAHNAGLVHRDVKPANVLIDEVDNRAKLTDFGLARATDSQEGITEVGQFAGTPEYLSPEQATDASHADARSDVYALGVTLYECLTGVVPFRGNLPAILHAHRNLEPVAPRRLNSHIAKDLETICLKCLAKDPSRRYQTAKSLADDLKNWRDGKPILARPTSPWERGWRWCYRNPRVAGLSAALGLVVLLATATGFVLWQRAEHQKALAQDRQKEAEDAVAREQVQRQAAEQNLNTALDTVDRFCLRVSEDELLKIPGMELVRRKLLQDAIEHQKQFVSLEGNSTRATIQRARALRQVSFLLFEMGELKEAVAQGREAVRVADEAMQADKNSRDTREAYAFVLYHLGRCLTAERKIEEAVAVEEKSATIFAGLVKESPQDWKLVCREAQARIAWALACIQYDSLTTQSALQNQHVVSILEPVVAAQPQAVWPKQLLADVLSSQATARMTQDDIPLLLRVRALREELVKLEPDVLAHKYSLGQANMNLGVLYKWGQKYADSRKAYLAAINAFEKLVADGPRVVGWRRFLGRAYFNLGMLNQIEKQPQEALKAFTAAAEHYERLLQVQATEPVFQLELCLVLAGLAEQQQELKQTPECLKTLGKARETLQQLYTHHSLSSRQKQYIAESIVLRFVSTLCEMDKVQDAVAMRDSLVKYLEVKSATSLNDSRPSVFLVDAALAHHKGREAMLTLVKDWEATYPDNATELAKAARALAILKPQDQNETTQARAKDLLSKARKRGWKPDGDWQTDDNLKALLQ